MAHENETQLGGDSCQNSKSTCDEIEAGRSYIDANDVAAREEDGLENVNDEQILNKTGAKDVEESEVKDEDEDEEGDDDDDGGRHSVGDPYEYTSSTEEFWTCGGSDEGLASGHVQRFPPPISILSNVSHYDLPRHMPRVFWRSLKRDGRFILQEVRVCPQEFFTAIREDGRLRLYLTRSGSNDRITERMQETSASRTTQEMSLTNVESSASDYEKLDSGSGNPGADCKDDDTSPDDFEGVHSSDEKGTVTRRSRMDLKVDGIGDQLRQVSRPAQCAASSFDDAVKLLAPTQSFLHFSFTRMRAVIG